MAFESNIRRASEADRAPEFKTERDTLVGRVNGWLAELAASKAGTLDNEPRIAHTDLGATGPMTRAFATEFRAGASLNGDGREKPFIFERVGRSDSGGTEVIVVRGEDPLLAMSRAGSYTGTGNETVVAFSVTDKSRHGDRSFGFTIRDDGSILRSYVENGVNKAEPLTDASVAVAAFELLAAELPG